MSTTAFPHNVLHSMSASLTGLTNVSGTKLRRLEMADANNLAGIYATRWEPGKFHIRSGQRAPMTAKYHYEIQHVHRSADSATGHEFSVDVAREIRQLLYRDAALDTAIQALSETASGLTESTLRWGTSGQTLWSKEGGKGQFLHVSVTSFWVETQTA